MQACNSSTMQAAGHPMLESSVLFQHLPGQHALVAPLCTATVSTYMHQCKTAPCCPAFWNPTGLQCLQLLAMVPQPVLAVMLLFPITKESEEADKKGEHYKCSACLTCTQEPAAAAAASGCTAQHAAELQHCADHCPASGGVLHCEFHAHPSVCITPPHHEPLINKHTGPPSRKQSSTSASCKHSLHQNHQQAIVSSHLLHLCAVPLHAFLAAADSERPADAAAPEQLYYMKQTIGNACGTIAMLHSIGNNRQRLQLGAWHAAVQQHIAEVHAYMHLLPATAVQAFN